MTLGLARPAPSVDAYESAGTPIREVDLWRGYSPAIVSRACLCGHGRIEALDTPGAIAEAVLVHNSSTAHGAWAVEHGWR